MDWTNIHAWKSKSLFAHKIQKNRKDVKPYPIKLDNGPLSLAICLGTMVATMFMFFAKVPVATVCLTAYYYLFVCVFTGSLRQWKWTRIYGQLQIALFQPRGRQMGLVFNNRRTNCKLNQDGPWVLAIWHKLQKIITAPTTYLLINFFKSEIEQIEQFFACISCHWLKGGNNFKLNVLLFYPIHSESQLDSWCYLIFRSEGGTFVIILI